MRMMKRMLSTRLTRAAMSLPIFLAATMTALLLAGCGSVQRTYWDARVEEMCRRDGGVTVYERVKVTREQYANFAPVYPRRTARPGALYVADNETVALNDQPEVLRSETRIVRTSDGKVLSRSVHYVRVGRDFLRPYGCHEVGIPMDIEGQTFQVVGD